MKKIFLLCVVFAGCATRPPAPAQQCNPGLALVNATAWVSTSAEYRASALQTYTEARRALDTALSTSSDRPAAIILDLDETAIDNTKFEARVIRQGKTYDADTWKQWVSESAAGATPGAAEFLTYAKSRGVTPFYITNRKAVEEAAIRKNLEKLGYPLDGAEDTLLARGERPEWSSSDKTPRREFVAARYRVLLVLGDDLNDFVAAADKSLEERSALVRENSPKFGTSWFILPNPMYGSWETAVAGNGTACDELQRKIEVLKP
ncbi:MAG TPA: HAD family acid phosphatase [Thermoanaerobaculia bacterium]|nr:HAD family acid phosphatase [Thermoanaerobaculia bacterium]